MAWPKGKPRVSKAAGASAPVVAPAVAPEAQAAPVQPRAALSYQDQQNAHKVDGALLIRLAQENGIPRSIAAGMSVEKLRAQIVMAQQMAGGMQVVF